MIDRSASDTTLELADSSLIEVERAFSEDSVSVTDSISVSLAHSSYSVLLPVSLHPFLD